MRVPSQSTRWQEPGNDRRRDGREDVEEAKTPLERPDGSSTPLLRDITRSRVISPAPRASLLGVDASFAVHQGSPSGTLFSVEGQKEPLIPNTHYPALSTQHSAPSTLFCLPTG